MNFREYYDEVIFDTGQGLSRPLFATRGDRRSRGLYVLVYESGQRISDLSQLTLAFLFKRPDKEEGVIIAEADGGVFRVDFSNQVFSIPGVVQAELTLLGNDNEIISSRPFAIKVRADLGYDALLGVDEENPLQKIIEFVEERIPVIESQESARQFNELERELAEGARESAETLRGQSESLRVSAEEARETVEGAREIAEDTRANQENMRESNEIARVSTEIGRVTAENTRVAQENSRKNEEEARATAESARTSKESSRISAENARVSAEDVRTSAESVRESNENTRKSNETARKSAETDRVSAETSRVNAEDAREEAEDARASAEGARENNEITRGSNETARESAETDRISAETSRVNAEDAREEAEGQRQDAEDVRMGNELMRISNMQVVEGWIADPIQFKGDTGDSFEYVWDDTRLGVKTDKESSYSYVDLKGEKGNTGDLHADDEIPAEPTPRDADTLGGQPRSYYDGRIDNIISTPTDISEQEIIDARHNSVTDTTHNSLGARLNEDSNKIETLGEDFAEHKLDYVKHLNSNMPHKMKVDGRDYKYGFSQENGFVKFVYEEVI